MLGSWINNIPILNKQFNSGKPYCNVVIDDFFSEETAKLLQENFPKVDSTWHSYWNPIEKKHACNNFDNNPVYKNLFLYMQTDEFVDIIKQTTGIGNLESDPTLHGAGVHFHPNGGKLDMHLDYSLHPILNKERRVNLIIYMNKDWKDSYNGELQLWNKEFTHPAKRVYPLFNRAILFQTNDVSYHGMPTMIACPEGEGRKSIAIYYISEPSNIGEIRLKANFRPLPDQPVNEQLKTLYDIRNSKTITNDILNKVYPNWEREGNGYW